MDAAVIAKVASLSWWNGGSLVVIAGLAAAMALAGGSVGPALFGAAIAAAGVIEFRAGRALLNGGAPAAARPHLVGAELSVLLLIVGYSVWRLASADIAAEIAALPAEVRGALVGAVGGDEMLLAGLFALALKITYGTLILVSLVYQGGLAWWYSKALRSPA